MKRWLLLGLAGGIVVAAWLGGCRVDVSLDPRVDAAPVPSDGAPDGWPFPDAGPADDDGGMAVPDAMLQDDAG